MDHQAVQCTTDRVAFDGRPNVNDFMSSLQGHVGLGRERLPYDTCLATDFNKNYNLNIEGHVARRTQHGNCKLCDHRLADPDHHGL